jgi:hypothetical protein
MHGVNLDLLRTTPYHPDGGPKDPHAHHRSDHTAALAEERQGRRRNLVSRILSIFRRSPGRRTAATTH